MLPFDCCAVSSLELQHHGEQGGVDVPDAGEDEGDDGEAGQQQLITGSRDRMPCCDWSPGHAPHHAHLHVQQPGREVRPLRRPEVPAAVTLNKAKFL